MPNIRSPRTQRWFVQQQTSLLAFNNASGTWTNTGAKMIRVDAGSVTLERDSPYSRFPVLTGQRSDVPGIRGRKASRFTIRNFPIIPSGTAGTVPDFDTILQNIFGQAATIVASTSATYSFNDSGYLPFSLFGFEHGASTQTQQAAWGCYVTRITFNFNGAFLTADIEGFCGYAITSTAFSAYDTQAKAGLTAFPTEPGSPSVAGSPIAGFGTGYTCTIDGQDISLKVRAMSLTIETGFVPVADVYGSPYLAAVVGDSRRVGITIGDSVDDDSSQLNDIKTKADTDNTTVNAAIVAGNSAGSIATFNINNIQLNAFNTRDSGSVVAYEQPLSYAHASSVSVVDDMTLAFT